MESGKKTVLLSAVNSVANTLAAQNPFDPFHSKDIREPIQRGIYVNLLAKRKAVFCAFARLGPASVLKAFLALSSIMPLLEASQFL